MSGEMTRALHISKMQIVCGDNASKPGIWGTCFDMD